MLQLAAYKYVLFPIVRYKSYNCGPADRYGQGMQDIHTQTALVIRPTECFQVRIQLASGSTGPLAVGRDIIRSEGIMSLYKGLSAGVLRQAVYTTARLGLFSTFLDALSHGQPKQATFGQRAASGLSAGVSLPLSFDPLLKKLSGDHTIGLG